MDIIKTLANHKKLLLLAAILLVIFNKYIVFLSLSIALIAFGMMTMKVSRIVPHINIESISASATLIGYIWGWKAGLIFGIVAGLIGWISVSLIKHTTLAVTLFMGLNGVLGAFFQSMGYGFTTSFFLAFAIRAPLNFFILGFLTADRIENFSHAFGDSLFSVLIYSQLLNIIYIIIKPFV